MSSFLSRVFENDKSIEKELFESVINTIFSMCDDIFFSACFIILLISLK